VLIGHREVSKHATFFSLYGGWCCFVTVVKLFDCCLFFGFSLSSRAGLSRACLLLYRGIHASATSNKLKKKS